MSEAKSQFGIKSRLQLLVRPLLLALFIHLIFILFLIHINAKKQSQHEVNKTPRLPALLVTLQSKPKPVITKPIENNLPAPINSSSIAIDREVPTKKLLQKISEETELHSEQYTTDHSKTDINHQASIMISEHLRKELLNQIQHNQDAATAPALGKFTAHDFPLNWTKEAVAYTAGMFKGAERKRRIDLSKAVVIESWRGTDGSFNTKMRLPNGDMICGSRSLGDPFNAFANGPSWMFFRC